MGRMGVGAGPGVRIKVRKVSRFRMQFKDSIKVKNQVVKGQEGLRGVLGLWTYIAR